jgi:ketosteroid isomerase-like protein
VAREHTNPAGTNNETAIREIFDKWAAAVRAEDFNAIRANHSPEMLMFDVPPPLFSRGLDACMDTWTALFRMLSTSASVHESPCRSQLS